MKIEKGIKTNKGIKTVLYGPGGIGKSTLASQFPSPVFDDIEGSTNQMDVARFETAQTLEDVERHIQELLQEDHDYKTYVIDSGDYLQSLCVEYICRTKGVPDIEHFGYGKGYLHLADKMRDILFKLNELIEAGINVVIVCHSMITKFELPQEQSSFDRYSLKLQSSSKNSVADLVKEWSDLMLFLNFETYVLTNDQGKTTGQGERRVMYTTYHPCWDSKNRFGLKPKLNLDYSEISFIFPTLEKPITKLKALMVQDNIRPEQIMAISQKRFPNVPIERYSQEFLKQLINNWESVRQVIKQPA